MKELKTLLSNAIEDYFLSLNRDITLLDLEAVCSFNLSEVAFNALQIYYSSKTKPIANSDTKTAEELLKSAEKLLGNNDPQTVYAQLKYMFQFCEKNGYNFHFGTRHGGLYDTLPTRLELGNSPFVAFGVSKIKK